jgi:cytochrome c
MKKIVVCLMAVVVAIGAVCAAYAASAEGEAKELALKAASFIKETGKDKAVSEMKSPTSRFAAQLKSSKLNLGVNDLNGNNLVNTSFPALVGTSNLDMRDPNGKYFIKDAIEIAKTKGGGWMEFAFTDPATKKIGRNKAWVQKVEGMDLWVMCVISGYK